MIKNINLLAQVILINVINNIVVVVFYQLNLH